MRLERTSRVPTAGLVLALLFLAGVLAAQEAGLLARTYSINVELRDAGGKPIPDALVVVRAYNRTASERGRGETINQDQQWRVEGYTSLAGRARVLLRVGANQSTPSAFVTLYAPYWSSKPLALDLPDRPVQVIEESFDAPLELNTYRLRLLDEQGDPIQLAMVDLDWPYPLLKSTDANGMAQWRLPPNLSVQGKVQYGSRAESFEFGDTSGLEGPAELVLRAPLRGTAGRPANQTYDWTVQLRDSMGRVIDVREVNVTQGNRTWRMLTDYDGYLYLRGRPEEMVGVSWVGYNYTYRFDINLSRSAPAVLRMPLLINISNPVREALGDSCYRISVNVTDQRKQPGLRVWARAVNGTGTLPFSLDKTAPLANDSGLEFSRVLCVDEEMTFDILADNPFEQTSLQIQLKTDTAEPVPSQYVQPPPDFLKFNANRAAQSGGDPKKLEMLLILIYALVVLVALFMALRFRGQMLYYLQSIFRFTYVSYQDRQTGHEDKEKK